MKRLLITGIYGLLGQNLTRALHSEYEIIGVDIVPQAIDLNGVKDYIVLDITLKDRLIDFFKTYKPDIIINTAALTNVDLCEKERKQAENVNYRAVELLLETCGPVEKFVQISTDYVFDGKHGPYNDDARPKPVSVYGQSKLSAEQAVLNQSKNNLVVRTMIIFGNGKNVRPDYVRFVKESLSNGKEINIVTDQLGNITLASNLAANIGVLIRKGVSGIVSLSGSDVLSRYDIAQAIARYYRLDASLITPIKTSDLKQAAQRPLNSGFTLNRARNIAGTELLPFKALLEKYDHE
jgi:dTDP-4-dehydrorhamnose reductase